jgi:ABC-2 type transport system ATP-binding protein
MSETGSCRGETLVTDHLVKVYRGGGVPALNGLTLSIGGGQIFGLLGPNGAGKTTAISVMNTLLKPTSGGVTVCGVDVVKNPRHAKKLIGYVPQDIALYLELSVRENLGFFGRVYGLSGKELEQRIEECAEFVGLEGNLKQRVFTLSGGMKRRANLAAGLMHKPKVLFLDEPTVGIDPQSRNLILERLATLKDETTMVYTTHYMREPELLCSYVAIMDAGEVIAEGTPQDLLSRDPSSTNLEELFIALTGKQLRD